MYERKRACDRCTATVHSGEGRGRRELGQGARFFFRPRYAAAEGDEHGREESGGRPSRTCLKNASVTIN